MGGRADQPRAGRLARFPGLDDDDNNDDYDDDEQDDANEHPLAPITDGGGREGGEGRDGGKTREREHGEEVRGEWQVVGGRVCLQCMRGP